MSSSAHNHRHEQGQQGQSQNNNVVVNNHSYRNQGAMQSVITSNGYGTQNIKNLPDFTRSGSRDNVRKIVEKEGKIARNLVAWSVPNKEDTKQGKRFRLRRRKGSDPIKTDSYVQRGRPKEKKPTSNRIPPGKSNNQNQNKPHNDGSSDSDSKERETKSKEYQERIRKAIEKGSEGTFLHQRPSSAASMISQKNLRARYWSYLFDNFHRAVDEIYSTCETDESVIECQEVMMMLDVCKRDFEGLIHRLKLFNKLETSQIRPHCLAWEVRKQMSPGKCPSPTLNSRRSPSPAAVRFLNFGGTKPMTFSWADRVRGIATSNASTETNMEELKVLSHTHNESTSKVGIPSPVFEMTTDKISKEIKEGEFDEDDDDNEGWEIVTKGRCRSKASSMSLSSTSSNHSKIPDAIRKNVESGLSSTVVPTVSQNNNELLFDLNLPDVINLSSRNSLTSTIPDFEKDLVKVKDFPQNDKKNFDSYADTLDFSYDFTEDEIQIQIKEEQEKALASAIAEEETLTKELEEEALKVDDQDDDISSDRDYVTIDDGRETPKDLSEELPLDSSMDEPERQLTWEEMCLQYDREHESGLGVNWGEMMEITETMRQPGRALEMHQKLSSPSRKKSRSESVKRSEERMARAERRRLRLLVDKCERLKDLSERVRKVRHLKNKLISEKERTMMDHMKRAELNRKILIQEKIKKAQEEEMKVNEIAFINTLEAQNKKMEVEEKHQVSEARLHDILEERQRRKEDKHAKEEAAQERRRALEEERLARLQEIKQKRGDQAVKWKRERFEREKAREELAKERQKEREMKVAARNEALQQAAEELQKRIEQKHIESTRRHEQRIEEVKEKSRAASSSRHATVEETPSSIPYDKLKKCALCDVEIASDVYMVSHLKGNKHKQAVREVNKKVTDAEMEAFSSKYIKDADVNNLKKQKEIDERFKAMKKRAKKIKARMGSKGKEYEANIQSINKIQESSKRGKFQKCIKEINKVLQAHSNGPWPANKVASLDKALSEILRSVEGQVINDQRVFCQLGGLAVLSRVLLLWDTSNMEKPQKNMVVPPKIIKHASEAIQAACMGCLENSQYFLLSNKLGILVDLLAYRLKVLDGSSDESSNDNSECTTPDLVKTLCRQELTKTAIENLRQDDGLTLVIMSTISMIMRSFCPKWPLTKVKNLPAQDLPQRIIDIVSYIVCTGVLEKLIKVFSNIQGPLENLEASTTINSVIHFFQPLALCVVRLDAVFTLKKEDLSLISQIMQTTEVFGLVALIYSLLHQGSATRISPSPLPLADSTILILITALKSLNILALVDLHAFQNTIASEGASLQYRSVISYLLRYISNERCDELLHEVILSIGFFTLLNHENQIFIQSGRAPSLIQQLCTLPFGYFSDPKLKNILFPTLISVSYNNNENKKIVAQDVNPTLLAIYLEEQLKEKLETPVTIDSMDQRSLLDLRLPRKLWEEVKSYFTEPETEMS